jgi:DNA-directed RNA polymerase subunit M/transcription elongation factor TFIIS
MAATTICQSKKTMLLSGPVIMYGQFFRHSKTKYRSQEVDVMSEAISFWLDNKMASAHKVAEIGDQVLVDYRGKFYVIRNGSALMKGSKPLHYSRSSMPVIWKKALRGELPNTATVVEPDDEILPMTSVTKRVRAKKEKEAPMPEASPAPVVQQATASKTTAKPIKKAEPKAATQTTVAAQCPYCSQKHEIPLEKGRNGKPFFVTCTKCTVDFAVRFIPVTLFQAQVAAFR